MAGLPLSVGLEAGKDVDTTLTGLRSDSIILTITLK